MTTSELEDENDHLRYHLKKMRKQRVEAAKAAVLWATECEKQAGYDMAYATYDDIMKWQAKIAEWESEEWED